MLNECVIAACEYDIVHINKNINSDSQIMQKKYRIVRPRHVKPHFDQRIGEGIIPCFRSLPQAIDSLFEMADIIGRESS